MDLGQYVAGNAAPGGVARAFVEARKAGTSLKHYPGRVPADLAAAYGIQSEALALDGRAIAGWKLGRILEPDATCYGADRLVGPIFAGTVVEEVPGVEARMPVYAGGFMAVEAEFMLRLKVPAHGMLPVADAAVLDWIDEVRIGIELASSPYAGINDEGPCVTVSDFGNNAGVLLGAAVHDWRVRDLCAISVTTKIDGLQAACATAATMLDGPFGAVRFLLTHLGLRGITPQSGWWVSSGAVTGVHAVAVGQHASVSFAGVGSLECRIVAVKP